MANELRLPMVRLVDGTGGGGSVKTLRDEGCTYVPRNPAWELVVANLGTVPVVALGLGSVAGLGAARLVTSHYSLMVTGISQMFIAGPPVVARLGETLTKEELGGSEIHARNGAVDDVVDERGRRPSRARGASSPTCRPRSTSCRRARPSNDDPGRREAWLIEAIPRDRRKVYRHAQDRRAPCVDRGSFFEIGKQMRRLGRSPAWRGSTAGRSRCWRATLTSTAAAGRPRPVAEGHALRRPRRDLPSAGGASRRHPGLRHRRRRPRRPAPSATARGRSPRSTRRACRGARSCVRKAFGVAGAAHPTCAEAALSATPGRRATGARCRSRAASRRPTAELDAAPDPRRSCAARSRRASTRCARPSAPPRRFGVEEIIDPRDTRALLCEFANLTAGLREPGAVATAMRP